MTRRRNNISPIKEIYYILFIIAVVVSSAVSIWGPGGYLELRKAQLDLEKRRTRIETLKRSNNERTQSIEALRSDRETLEKVAREKGYGKKGEVVQHLAPESQRPTR